MGKEMAKRHVVQVIGSGAKGTGVRWNHPGKRLFTSQFIPNRSDDLKEKAFMRASLSCHLRLDLDNMADSSVQLGFGNTA